MSKLCCLCKERPATVRACCEQCRAELDEKWNTINRRSLNEIWQDGGCGAVEDYHTEQRTCEKCGTLNEERWSKCSGCGSSRLQQCVDAMRELEDRLRRKLDEESE